MRNCTDFNTLIGKTLSSVTVNDSKDEIIFTTTDGESYKMYHEQDCCESVDIEDICGELEWLVGSPIIRASEDTSNEPPEGWVVTDYWDESRTWTFYNIATAKGHVTIRWYGSSNGYYSESVDFVRLMN